RSMKIPEAAENVTVSYNGMYAAYKLDNNIVLVNLDKRKEVRTLTQTNGSFTFFRWLPDRDMLIYSAKEPDGKSGEVGISTYDIEAELERSYPNITDLAEGSSVVDIELSPLTNVVYTMIRTGETKTKVYKFNIMDDLSYIMSATADTILKETSYVDKLVYQKPDGKITIRNGKTGKASTLSRKGSYVLLAVDKDDRIYAGQVDENGKVGAVVFGKTDVKSANWEKIELASPADASDVFITPDGGIFVDDPETDTIESVSAGTSLKYEGSMIEMLDDYCVSLDGRKLEVKVLDQD
ncbi:MAG: hypothetical protein HGA22_13090, partial [Clostridiales bacterium]|nr:hypothetical protein [Clostridiales bacterium]